MGQEPKNIHICWRAVLEVILSLRFLPKIIFFIYRYDEQRREIEEGYPKDMRNWRGVPSHIDGVVTWRDGTKLIREFEFTFQYHIF